jgi:diadenosine tetraphosphatase ApaH/serine/threonine PP2A family protein phosphatase
VRIALLTDLHANREALSACLDAVAALGAQRYVFLGDLIGYGADPAWVVDTVRRYVDDGAVCVQGNHDQAVAHGASAGMHAQAQRAIAWTAEQLDASQRDFLASLPLLHTEDDRCYAHANAWAPAGWEYVSGPVEAGRSLRATPQRLSFLGHVHTAALYHGDRVGKVMAFAPTPGVDIPLLAPRRWLAIPGAVGQPRDGNPAAACAVYDSARAQLRFLRVPYDAAAAAEKVRAAGLPPALARRLERGA